jgi:hypothetical protein
MTSFDTLQKHQILNCGDMKKDGKEDPNITSYKLFNDARDYITGINCKTEGDYFQELKKVINDELLEHVKKYCFGTLLPIPEDKVPDNNLTKVTFINKNSRKVVPVNVINAFIDASMDPYKYFMANTINICETPASNIDPGARKDNNSFLPNINENYPLNSYGFKVGSQFNYRKNMDKDDYKYIEIILDSNNYFKGLVNRKGKIGDSYTVSLAGTEYNKSNVGSLNSIFENLFQGNTEKNNYVRDNKDTKDNKIKMLCTLLIFFKELGDTTQPIVISQLFGKEKSIEKDNSCLLTIDTILACRSALINVPYLLNSNSIITYYAVIDEEKYEKNMKISEIEKCIKNNEKIIEEYRGLLDIIQRDSNEIIIQGATYKINEIVKKRFRDIIDCINKANEFLNILKEQLEDKSGLITRVISIILTKTNYKQLSDLPFYKFRTLVQCLQGQSIFVYRGKKRKIITGKYCVFPQKLIIKKEFFSWEGCIDNILFEGGVLNFIVKSRYQGQSGGTKEIDTSDFDENEYNILYCYSLLYPYIYCNPYLLPYILKKNDQELIEFLNTIISNILLPDYNDKKEPINNFIVPNVDSISDDEINNLYSEELLYYLDDNNKLPNMEIQIDNYEIYTNKLLEKLEFFVKNIPDISLLQKKIEAHIIQDDLELPDADDLSSEPKSPKRKVENIQERPSTPIKQFEQEQEIKDTPDSPSGKRQRRIIITKGGKKTKNKNKKSKNKKTKKKYKSKSKIVYKKKNIKKRITKKKNIKKRITKKKNTNKRVRNTKKREK